MAPRAKNRPVVSYGAHFRVPARSAPRSPGLTAENFLQSAKKVSFCFDKKLTECYNGIVANGGNPISVCF